MKKVYFALVLLLTIAIIFILLAFNQFKTARVIEESQTQINLNKQEFLPYETLQIEILGNFKRPITKNDIYIKKNSLIMPVNFYVEKINKNYYFAYASLNLMPSNYVVEIKLNTERGVEIYRKDIKIIENNNNYYLDLLDSVKNRWHLLSNRELIYSRQAVEGINIGQDNLAFNEFMQRQSGFNDIEKALSLIVTTSNEGQWQIQKSKLLNYFLTLQDNSLGQYKIKIETPIELNCTINSNSIKVIGEKNISINLASNSSFNFSFYCFKLQGNNVTNITQQELNSIDVSLIKNYLENKKVYLLNKRIEAKDNYKAALFWIEKEFGSINNDAILTSLALISFYQNNISQYNLAYSWLKSKQNLGVIENIALAMLNDSNAINNLLALQNYDGSFNGQANFSKAELTCLAYKTNLPTKTSIYEWIKNNIKDLNIKDKASCLVFALEKQDIVSILPGIIKTETGKSFDLYLKNYGLKEINVSLKNLVIDLNYTTSIKVGQLKKLTIVVPSISYSNEVLKDRINVHYGKKFYSIPLIIFIKRTNITESEINETETNEVVINQTQEEANITKPILNIFSFNPESININVSDTLEMDLKIKNIANSPIKNIIISQSASLFGVIKNIEPSIINQINPNEEKSVKILFDVRDQQLSSFTGTLTIEGIINGFNYEKEIPVNIVVNKTLASALKTCNELNGTICKVDEKCEGNIIASLEGACCIGKCVGKSKQNKIIGIIFILLAFIILIAAVIVILKKPRKERKIEEVIKRIQEKQKLKEKESLAFRPKI